MSTISSTDRFLRPEEPGRTRRYYRHVQVQRVIVIFANVVLAALLTAGALWIYRHFHTSSRFAVKKVIFVGASKTSAAEIGHFETRYAGRNLFSLDIMSLRRDVASLPWVDKVAIEKKLPGTLSVRVSERIPVALVRRGNVLHYADASGFVIAPLTPSIGDRDLPIVAAGDSEAIRRAIGFLQTMAAREPEIYSRISEIAPLLPSGFSIFERELGATLLVAEDGSVAKWKRVHEIARAAGRAPGALQYADLRFRDQIVVRPMAGDGRAVRPADHVAAPAGALVQ